MKDKNRNKNTRGLITEPLVYLKNRFGDTHEYVLKKLALKNFDTTPMNSLERGANCCTLAAAYKALLYTGSGESLPLPSDKEELWKKVRDTGLTFGYSPKRGIGVTKNRRFINRLWKNAFNIKAGKSKSLYFALIKPRLLRRELEAGRPVILALASGYYFNHTVAVYGYEEYTDTKSGKSYCFLLLSDGWNAGPTYLAWTGTGACYIACATTVAPPLACAY